MKRGVVKLRFGCVSHIKCLLNIQVMSEGCVHVPCAGHHGCVTGDGLYILMLRVFKQRVDSCSQFVHDDEERW